jgi:hypothetical protein
MSDVTADPARPRVFGIGLNKTGTSSLHRAMELLGYRSLHWGGPPVRQAVEAALAAGEPMLARLDPSYDAFSDILPIARHFDVLDEQYPGSRFVLTVRDVDQWVQSRRRHVEHNQALAEAGEYQGTFLVVDEAAWRDEWHDHVGRVRRHFAGRTDFAEVDIAAGDGWAPFVELLGVEPPEVPFPWENRRQEVG